MADREKISTQYVTRTFFLIESGLLKLTQRVRAPSVAKERNDDDLHICTGTMLCSTSAELSQLSILRDSIRVRAEQMTRASDWLQQKAQSEKSNEEVITYPGL